MRSVLLCSTFAAAISVTGVASAADLGRPAPAPVYTKAPIAAPPLWTGFYAGVEGGYGWSSDPAVTFSPNDPLAVGLNNLIATPPVSFKTQGGFGGITAGYNWQMGRTWLVGLETDFSGADIKGSGTATTSIAGPALTLTDTASQKVDWFGTVRARAGWLATDNLLLYGTGGFAYGRVADQTNAMFSTNIGGSGAGFTFTCLTNVPCFPGSSSRIGTGWTAGAGAEYLVPGTRASFKIEYLFVDLGTSNVTAINTAPAPGTSASSFNGAFGTTEFHTVKAGLNWHF